MHELFGYMELSILAIVTGEPSMNIFSYRPWEGISPREDVESALALRTPSDSLTETLLRGVQGLCRGSRALLEWWSCHSTPGLAKVNFRIAPFYTVFPMVLKHEHLCHRLFHSHLVDVTPEPHERKVFDIKADSSLFSIKYNDEDGSNDLLGCLASQVFPKISKRGSLNADPSTTRERAITEAAEVIAFAPARDESLPSYQDSVTGKPQRRKFSFPGSFYLDRFLRTNHERAQKVIQNGNVAEEEIRRLTKKKSELTKLDVSDIRSVLVYGKLTGATEKGCDAEHPIFTILL